MPVNLVDPRTETTAIAQTGPMMIDMHHKNEGQQEDRDSKRKVCNVRAKVLVAILAFGMTLIIMLIATLWGIDGLFSK